MENLTSRQSAESTGLSEAELYRKRSVEIYAPDAVGSLHAYSNTNLSREDKMEFIRNSEAIGRKSLIEPSSGGWMDFGEVPTNVSLERVKKEVYGSEFSWPINYELLYVSPPTERDTVLLEYRVADKQYFGSIGRPGNYLQVGYEMSTRFLDTFLDEIKDDPTLIRALIKAQLEALGLPDSVWKKIKPDYSTFEIYAKHRGEEPVKLDVIEDHADGGLEVTSHSFTS